jgi:CheY-like chemotaxis protein
VDDDDFGREALGQILTGAGYLVACAASTGEALDRLRTAPPPGLIVLDVLAPLVGWQFCARQRRDPRLADIPLIVVSADDASVLTAQFGSIVRSFTKPIAVADLLDAIGRHCRRG